MVQSLYKYVRCRIPPVLTIAYRDIFAECVPNHKHFMAMWNQYSFQIKLSPNRHIHCTLDEGIRDVANNHFQKNRGAIQYIKTLV